MKRTKLVWRGFKKVLGWIPWLLPSIIMVGIYLIFRDSVLQNGKLYLLRENQLLPQEYAEGFVFRLQLYQEFLGNEDTQFTKLTVTDPEGQEHPILVLGKILEFETDSRIPDTVFFTSTQSPEGTRYFFSLTLKMFGQDLEIPTPPPPVPRANI